MTAPEIHKALRTSLYGPRDYVYITEFRAGTGLGASFERYLDAWVMNPFPSTPMKRIAIEIKVSRNDFNKEKRNWMKRDAAMRICNQFYFAAPEGMLREDEIPEECGLIEISKSGTAKITIEAPHRDNLPTWPLVASLMRRIEELEEQIEGNKAMTAVQKLTEYKNRLIKWKKDLDARIPGAGDVAEPNPNEYGLTSPSLQFMAKGIREEVLGKAA